MAAPTSPDAIRDVNTRYHDAAAEGYDTKWGIDFHEVGAHQVLGKMRKALGRRDLGHHARALEIGAGTGYFSLNLVREGVIGHATCTDISPGMLATLDANAARIGLGDRVETVRTDAEHLPFEDASFDMVLGHAVLHHLPDLRQAFSEFHRVLRPGGVLAFAGEPSRLGDRIAAYPKRWAYAASPLWRRLMRARPLTGAAPAVGHTANGNGNGAARQPDGHDLEPFVDVHAFDPATLRDLTAGAGFEDVRVRGEELLANWFGWANRTLEATAEPETVPWLWRQYAYRGYLALQAVDRVLLEPRLPAAIFYNLIVAARKPGA
jgi:ubiquinone/menaquinone biosynthesis C-methylase UbiE